MRILGISSGLCSDEIEDNVYISANSFRVGTCLMRGIDQAEGYITLYTRQANVKPSTQEIGITFEAKIDFGINSDVGRKLDFKLARREPQRSVKACRPASREELFWVGTVAFDTR